MTKKTIRDIDVRGKRVLVRVDFNVPMDLRSGTITNDSRIRAAIPTIKYLIEHGARIILCTHLGRPKGRIIEELRTKPLASRLSQLLNLPVSTAPDCIGPEVERSINELKEGSVLLLENVRFHPEEEANDPAFAEKLASLADIYVNDAFGAAHRAHASTVGIAKHIPAVAGLLMEKELESLGKILTSPERPFAALLGGAKISDKIGLIQNILTRVDFLLIGGGMASVFLKATGYEIGTSLVETDKQDVAQDIIKMANQNGISIWLPVDVVVAKDTSQETVGKTVSVSQIPPTEYIVDIGPRTIDLFSQQLRQCRTVFWNGPMGIYEIQSFAAGTKAMANLLASIPATTVIGGGSTAEVVEDMGLADKMSHVSTGGGASLKFLEGERLPGVEVLLGK